MVIIIVYIIGTTNCPGVKFSKPYYWPRRNIPGLNCLGSNFQGTNHPATNMLYTCKCQVLLSVLEKKQFL